MLKVLRRRLEITTACAPVLGPGIDVPSTPQQRAAAPVVAPAAVPSPSPPPLSTAAAHASLPPRPPSWTPGRCYHPAHVIVSDVRYGVLPERGPRPERATLLPCPHINPDGR